MSDKSEYFFQLDQLQAVATSTIDSVLSLNTEKMFQVKPINTQFNNNESYSHTFGYESLFEDKSYVDSLGVWFQKNWSISVILSLVYILLVFSGKYIMQSRTRFELRPFLIVWNLFLAAFSIMGTIRVWPDFIFVLSKRGVVYSICDNSYAYGITGFWSFLFCLSKLPELIDTLFIVLRKQELIFLHWYHHATVLVYCFFSYKDFSASGRWFMSMNYLVHSLMYSYYALKAMRVKVPRFISQLITTGQLVQMVAGCYVNYVAWVMKNNNQKCNNSDDNIFYSSLMYLSYFVLFLNFFINAYIIKKPRKPQQPQMEKSESKLVNKLNKTDENNNHISKSKVKKIN